MQAPSILHLLLSTLVYASYLRPYGAGRGIEEAGTYRCRLGLALGTGGKRHEITRCKSESEGLFCMSM